MISSVGIVVTDRFPTLGVGGVIVKKILPRSPVMPVSHHRIRDRSESLTEISKGPNFPMPQADGIDRRHRLPNLEPRSEVRAALAKDSDDAFPIRCACQLQLKIDFAKGRGWTGFTDRIRETAGEVPETWDRLPDRRSRAS